MSQIIDHEKLARKWFFMAGSVALLFIFFLVWVDDYLTNSTRESELNKVLKEVRSAQTHMPVRATDQRQVNFQ